MPALATCSSSWEATPETPALHAQLARHPEQPRPLLGHFLDGLGGKADHRRGPRLPGRDLRRLGAGSVHPLQREEEATVVHHGDADVPLPLLGLAASGIDDLPGIRQGEGALGSHGLEPIAPRPPRGKGRPGDISLQEMGRPSLLLPWGETLRKMVTVAAPPLTETWTGSRAAESGLPVPARSSYWMVTDDDVAGTELLVTTGYPAAGAA